MRTIFIFILSDIKKYFEKASLELANQTPALLNGNGYNVQSVQDTN
jgi:hypothetical protein